MCSQHIDKELEEDIEEHTDTRKRTYNTWVLDNTLYLHPTDHNLCVTSREQAYRQMEVVKDMDNP